MIELINQQSVGPEITAEEMDYILETQHGVVFLENRPTREYNIGEDTLAALFGYKNVSSSLSFLRRTCQYYYGLPIMDQWEPDHDARKRWRTEMNLQYGKIFKERYEDRNQFRVNNMTAMIGWLEYVVECSRNIGNDELSNELAKIHKVMLYPKKGRKFSDAYVLCEFIGEKLEFVELLEDKAEEALDLVSSYKPQYSIIPVRVF
ncbi:MAG: hypothetical protein Q8P92_02745 [Candidatus Daviesbacteria bacterium]|nr:hypothetical protein [Candidatus Daviesbacteria bacterium]